MKDVFLYTYDNTVSFTYVKNQCICIGETDGNLQDFLNFIEKDWIERGLVEHKDEINICPGNVGLPTIPDYTFVFANNTESIMQFDSDNDAILAANDNDAIILIFRMVEGKEYIIYAMG